MRAWVGVGGFGLEEAPGTKEELLRRLLVAEVAWACGTTAAHGLLRGGAVRGLWASALGLRGGDEDARIRGLGRLRRQGILGVRGGSRARITARPFGRERRARNGERKEMTLTRGSGRAVRGKETRARAGRVGREAQRG